jgi:hypothetical protein
MAVSEVAICNLALQKLGAARIVSLTQDDPNARDCNVAYGPARNRLLRRYGWNFAKSRAALTASGTTPAFDYDYAFPVPTDFLRLILPPDASIDWVVERIDGRRAILSNDAGPIYIRYVALVTDPTEFDPLFDDALACALAYQTCEKITQSNTKRADIASEFKEAIRVARQMNAFETLPAEAGEDSWLSARR